MLTTSGSRVDGANSSSPAACDERRYDNDGQLRINMIVARVEQIRRFTWMVSELGKILNGEVIK